ncbi:MAG: dehydrogenase [Rhodoferax sp.]|nr:dehydrogenase [Rhodoferax sp.]
MSYLLLIVEPPGQRAARTEAEGRAAYDGMLAFAASL